MSNKKYFTADLHLGHKNILTLSRRKFNTIEDHDNHVIASINRTVDPKSNLYILGDLGFHRSLENLRKYLLRIKCRNIHVVIGNHDRMTDLVTLRREGVILDVQQKVIARKNEKAIVCFHYPMREWEGYYRGYYHAYGHCHGTQPPYERSMDVGVDNIGYEPIEFDDLIAKIDAIREGEPSNISQEDKMINEYFPDLNTHYFTALCTGNQEIRDTIYRVLRRK